MGVSIFHAYVLFCRRALLNFRVFVSRGLVEESLGQPVDTMFRSFEEKPLGAASIGQVHRVTMNDGRRAVIKVRRGAVLVRGVVCHEVLLRFLGGRIVGIVV